MLRRSLSVSPSRRGPPIRVAVVALGLVASWMVPVACVVENNPPAPSVPGLPRLPPMDGGDAARAIPSAPAPSVILVPVPDPLADATAPSAASPDVLATPGDP